MSTRARWIAISIVLVLAVTAATCWSMLQIKPTYLATKPGIVTQIIKQPVVALNTDALPDTTPTARPRDCPTQPAILDSDGGWVVNWSEKSKTLPPAELVDFAWVTWPGTNHLKEQFNPSLHLALAKQAEHLPCQWRLVTISDGHDEATRVAMAELLMSASVRNEHVSMIAEFMARQPDAQGLTIDYEFSLPTTRQEVTRLYAKYLSPSQRSAPFEQRVDYITQGYTDLVTKLAQAMHRQGRVLRVAALVREQDQVSPTYVPPYLMDYDGLSTHADQVILMAYNHHWSTSDPGAISPTPWVAGIWEHTAAIENRKLALALPGYGYDWPVDHKGKRSGGSATVVTGAAHPIWTRIGASDGENRYSYTDSAGRKHEVWLPVAVTKKALADSITAGAPTMVWRWEY